MPPPSWRRFRDAALRADVDVLRPREPGVIVGDAGVVAHPEPAFARRRFSLGATFLGWSVAAFFTFVLLAGMGTLLVEAGLAPVIDVVDNRGLEPLAPGGLVLYLVATFLAYVIGGYAAGRIALWDGVKHGLLIVAWSIVLAVVGAAVAAAYAPALEIGVTFPTDSSDLTILGALATLLTLAAMLSGSAIGGMLGERYHARAHGLAPGRRRRARSRGRPF